MISDSPRVLQSTLYHRLFLLAAVIVLSSCGKLAPLNVSFSLSAAAVERYDFVEVTAAVSWPHASNPFVDAKLSGWFETEDGRQRWPVRGFLRCKGWKRLSHQIHASDGGKLPIFCRISSESRK